MARPRLIHFSFLLLLSSSCAWANGGSGHGRQALKRRSGGDAVEDAVEGMVLDRRDLGGSMPLPRSVQVEVVQIIERIVERHASPEASPTVEDDEDIPQLVNRIREAAIAQVTPGPSLDKRQDQGQIQALSNQLQQLSQQSRQVSQASQQLSQSSQQLSQSLQQATQTISRLQTSLASAQAAESAASSAAQSAAQAAQSAASAASAAVTAASSNAAAAAAAATASANSAISSAIASASASASAALASALSSASVSMSVVQASAASAISQAQADTSAVREQAGNQVSQAQGAAVSVTQAALAVVGSIIGSSLLTIVAFALILRYRRLKQRQAELAESVARSQIGYPNLVGSSNAGSGTNYAKSAYESAYGAPPLTARTLNSNGFPIDMKEPVPMMSRANTVSRPNTRSGPGDGGALDGGALGGFGGGGGGGVGGGGVLGRGVGFGGATAGGVGFATSDYGPTVVPTAPRRTMTGDSTTGNNNGGTFQLRDPPRGKLSLFPKDADEPGPPPQGPLPPVGSNSTSPKSGSPGKRGSKGIPPSLDTWLRAGTVSPFGTLNNDTQANNNKRNTRWPMKDEELGK